MLKDKLFCGIKGKKVDVLDKSFYRRNLPDVKINKLIVNIKRR